MKARLIVLKLFTIAVIVTSGELSATSDAEIDRLLKKLNKPALKSIKSPDGDIIDCVHMKNHPIYDHPLFKNHTIQMRPSSYPEGWTNLDSNTDKQSSLVNQLWTINGRCPKNSIPIRRTRREDILRAGSVKRYMEKYPYNITQTKQESSASHEYAIIRMKGKFNGARAHINVWKPYVQTREFSLAQMWVLGGKARIEAGWQVYPNHYGGDLNPRYFIFWTADNYKKKWCYNLDCPGFVQVNHKIALGAAVRDVSTLNGPQYDIPTTIWKDSRTGHWWLKFDNDELMGYWPSSLVSDLKQGATELHWGGEITDRKDGSQHTTTQMGSGRYAQEGYKKAAYFKNVEIINQAGLPQQLVGANPVVTQEHCYNLNLGNDHSWGTFFYYGGPGRNPNCT